MYFGRQGKRFPIAFLRSAKSDHEPSGWGVTCNLHPCTDDGTPCKKTISWAEYGDALSLRLIKFWVIKGFDIPKEDGARDTRSAHVFAIKWKDVIHDLPTDEELDQMMEDRLKAAGE